MDSIDIHRVIEIVDEILGNGYKLNSGEYAYFCPVCNHRKRKLQVQLEPTNPKFGSWQCWVCSQSSGTRGKSLVQLAKKFGTYTHVQELKSLTGNRRVYKEETIDAPKLFLPKEYIPLWEHSPSIIRKNALSYLYKRNLTMDDVITYRLGYCEHGRYRNRIIVPSYDRYGSLNYFTGREFYEPPVMPYLNPKYSKDFVGFELFINYGLPVYVVEGPFDAMAVKTNVIPLFGKTIPNKLKKSLIQSEVEDIYIGLDPDALKDNLEIAEYFMAENKNVYVMELPDDPADIGQKRFFEIAEATPRLTFDLLIKLKLK